MTACILDYPYKPALQNSRGQIVTAPFTTYDETYAIEYAQFAANKTNTDDINQVEWPSRTLLTDKN